MFPLILSSDKYFSNILWCPTATGFILRAKILNLKTKQKQQHWYGTELLRPLKDSKNRETPAVRQQTKLQRERLLLWQEGFQNNIKKTNTWKYPINSIVVLEKSSSRLSFKCTVPMFVSINFDWQARQYLYILQCFYTQKDPKVNLMCLKSMLRYIQSKQFNRRGSIQEDYKFHRLRSLWEFNNLFRSSDTSVWGSAQSGALHRR